MRNHATGRMALRAAAIVAAVASGTSMPCRAAVTISSKATKNIACASGVCTPTAKDAVLNVGDLTALLANGNVTVNTASGDLAKQVRDIEVSAGFSWASASSLTLDAYRSIVFDRRVSVAGAGAVVLTTKDGGKYGTLSFRPKASLSFLSPANSLTIDGKSYTLASTLASLAADIAGNPSGNYALSANYDARPDGAYATAPIATTFEGTFNGLGNTIAHLAIHGQAQSLNLGLFGEVGDSGIVNSIRLTDARIKGKANSYIGVLAGINFGIITRSFAGGSIQTKSGNIGAVAGGLVGYNHGTLDATSASTDISVQAKSPLTGGYLGGLVGDNDGTIEISYATGYVIGQGDLGFADSGGLVGFNEANVDNCYATTATSVTGNDAVGGVGGLIGENGLTVTNSYSTGGVIGNGEIDIGGSIGADERSGNGDLSDLYWDTTTSGITNLSQGAGNVANDPGITGETTAQLQAGLPVGFDPTIWAENPNVNGGLPYLIDNPPQ